MKRTIKGLFRTFGLEIARHGHGKAEGFDPLRNQDAYVQLRAGHDPRGSVLLSFITEPFMVKPGEHITTAHTNPGDSVQIANTFLELGYDVDVIHYRNNRFIPQRDYSFFVGARTNFERLARVLNSDCVKIVHLDTSHWVFNNHASYRRTLELLQRRGTAIRESQRIVEPNLAIEFADYATIVGNDSTTGTYRYAGKPIFQIPHTSCAEYPWPEGKDFEAYRKNFIWMGSNGFVHKGLDLVLEAFSKMPDHHLYVCGPLKGEEDFQRAYYKELYESPNIHAVGWVDVNGPEFVDLMRRCIGIVYPSCAECGAGNAITCMHGGLIPILSYECGTDLDESFGMILRDCSIGSIRNALETISSLSGERLQEMARNAWEFAKARHTRERFAEAYRETILDIMRRRGMGNYRMKEELLIR